MNKKQMIKNLAEDMKKTQVEAALMIDGVIDAIKKGLKKDGIVQFIGFGSFNVKKRKARKGRNPKTGEAIKIKPSKVVVFKIGKDFKDALNK